MFGTSGIRGRVGEEVTADLALDVGRALATDADRVVLGRDARRSGDYLADSVAAGLRECGTEVVRLGLASTPTVARSVAWRDADAGVVITASHNPAGDNGIKLWQRSGQAFDAERRDAIEERLRAESFDLAEWTEIGTESAWDESRDHHAEAIAEAVGPADLEVVVDLGNGAGGVSVVALQEMGCRVETLNAQPDGSFPGRPSEPTAETCDSLQELVANTDADLGIAHDGDADRMMAVTEDGEWVPGDVLLAIFGREAVNAAGGGGDRVAIPVDTSLAVDDAVSDVGGEVVRTPVGDVYVAERASEPDVAFGGEPSGAWIWPEETLCPDGPLAAATLTSLVADSGSLADLVETVPTYPIERDSVEVQEKGIVMDRIEEIVADRYDDVTTLDGVRVDLGDAWFLLRASGTQPLIRVTGEARDLDRAEAVFEEARSLVEDAT